MKKLKYLLFTIIPILLFTSKVNAENAPITPTVENELFMTAFSASSASDDETVWFNKALGENVNISNSNFDVVPLAYYYSLTLPVEANYTYTTSFTISLKYYYDIKSNSNYTFSKNKDKYKYVVYGDHINSYSCSINKDNITNYSNYSIEEIDVSCSYNFKQNVDSEYLTVGLNGQPVWVESGLSAFNGKVTNNLIAYISNVKNLKYSDGSNVIIDQNNKIIDQNNQNTDKILDSNKDNTNKILDSNKDTQNVIKDQFNSCRDSVNLLPSNNTTQTINGLTFTHNDDGTITINGTATASYLYRINSSNITLPSGTYTFSLDNVLPSNSNITLWRDTSTGIISFSGPSKTFTASTTFNLFRIVIHYNEGATFDNFVIKPMLVKGTSTAEYEQYGQHICSNKLDEQTKTSKNIWQTIKSFPSTFSKFFTDLADKIGKFFDNLLTGILDGLKSMFIPSDDFFSNWWDGFSAFMKAKLGFLAKPIDIFITFISGYLNLSDTNIVINIPNITVPNFEDNIIIKAQTFNWKQLLESKPSFKNLWDLYLDFIDVFLIFNFIGLCEITYARIFGGDTSAYEYYTVEDSYYYDSESGEVQGNPKHSERKTTRRKKV